jgi:membrane protease YdiL (CAAX protease family)
LWRLCIRARRYRLSDIASNGAVIAFLAGGFRAHRSGRCGWIIRLARVPLRDYLALKWPSWRELGCGLGVLRARCFAQVCAALTGRTPPISSPIRSTAHGRRGLLPLLVFSFAFLAPLQEEVLFRGFLYRGFAPALGMWPAILLIAALWAVTHLQYQWFFIGEIFVLGVVFGWLRAKSGSLLLPLILHTTVNSMAILEAFVTSQN